MGHGKSAKNRRLIEVAYKILEAIQPATVRAVGYQLFIRKLIPSMSKGDMSRVSKQLVYGRETGAIPWGWIVNNTNQPRRPATWKDPEEFARYSKYTYALDAWQFQQTRIEIWSEKATVEGTIMPVTRKYGVVFWPVGGFGSATNVHESAVESRSDSRPLKVIYVGDFDPSGLYMSNVDLPKRIKRYRGRVEIIRLALDRRDVKLPESELPSFPLKDKKKDPRQMWYSRTTKSRKCWELDALNPVALRERLETAIRREINWPVWQRSQACSDAEQKSLADYLKAWSELPRAIPIQG